MYHFLVCVISKHYDLHSEVSVLKLYWLLAKGIINGNIRQSKILYVCVHKDMCMNTESLNACQAHPSFHINYILWESIVHLL